MDTHTFLQRLAEAKLKDPGRFHRTDADPLATEEAIQDVEALVKARFPDSFRWYLQNIGAGGIGSESFYGVLPGSQHYLPDQLRSWRFAVSAGLLPVHDNGCGDAFGFIVTNGVCSTSVWWWDHEIDQLAELHPDFLDLVDEVAFDW